MIEIRRLADPRVVDARDSAGSCCNVAVGEPWLHAASADRSAGGGPSPSVPATPETAVRSWEQKPDARRRWRWRRRRGQASAPGRPPRVKLEAGLIDELGDGLADWMPARFGEPLR